jgi:threonine dehydrogenase-like Zn-dependent dehydrogenase
MNKNLTINMGNCDRRKYIPTLIDLVRSGEVEPMGILTQSEGCEPHGIARPTHSSTAQAESLNPHLLPLQTDPGAELRGQP